MRMRWMKLNCAVHSSGRIHNIGGAYTIRLQRACKFEMKKMWVPAGTVGPPIEQRYDRSRSISLTIAYYVDMRVDNNIMTLYR